MTLPMPVITPSRRKARRAEMADLLCQLIAFPSISGQERAVTEFLRDFATSHGLACDLWQSSERELESALGPLPPHIPLDNRPTLVLSLPGESHGPSLCFNAHSDVVSAPSPNQWSSDPWQGAIRDGKIFGRGACDTKGPLVAALFALVDLLEDPHPPAGNVFLEIVPGEEDCVGLGTLGSILRGWKADAAVVLEPTRNLPTCASRPGCRFTITTRGRSVHGTVKWLGIDAIALMRHVQDALAQLEDHWNDRNADPLFASFPIARPITVDTIHGGEWQGMLCDRCTLSGYLELLPIDDALQHQSLFRDALLADLRAKGVDLSNVLIVFGETYPGHRTAPNHHLCAIAESIVNARPSASDTAPAFTRWTGFNSGCEAGMRATRLATPTLVWGPGDLAHAHAADEHVAIADLESAAADFAQLARRWCNSETLP